MIRFSVEIEFPKTEVQPDRVGDILALALEEGLKCLGHERGITVNYYIEKMRARSVDLDKPVGEQE